MLVNVNGFSEEILSIQYIIVVYYDMPIGVAQNNNKKKIKVDYILSLVL